MLARTRQDQLAGATQAQYFAKVLKPGGFRHFSGSADTGDMDPRTFYDIIAAVTIRNPPRELIGGYCNKKMG